MPKSKPTPEYLTLGDLIGYLQTLDPSLPVGRRGHMGEFHPTTQSNFSEYHAMDFSREEEREIRILAIEPPDIGPEPD